MFINCLAHKTGAFKTVNQIKSIISFKSHTVYNRCHGNGPYGKNLTKKEPIRTLGNYGSCLTLFS